MMNNELVFDSAAALAEHLESATEDPRQRIRLAYRRTLSRTPNESEMNDAVSFVQAATATAQAGESKSGQQSQRTAWTAFCQSLLASAEFRYLN
jgi:hypothetical protein